MSSTRQTIENNIFNHPIMIYSKTDCPYSNSAKNAARDLGIEFQVEELDRITDGENIQSELEQITGQKSIPNIFVRGEHIGGCDEFLKGINSGMVQRLLSH
jgi:glutaredoxin 3